MEKQELQHPFILAVISGKGGVGKSMASVTLAEVLCGMGYRTALMDADIGLSNCATLLNETVTASVADWIRGDCMLEDLPHKCGLLTLVTGSDQPGKVEFQPDLMMDAMDQVADYLASGHDFILIDTPAGAGEMSLWALDRAGIGTVILVDEPTAISDVYRLCKYVYSIDPEYPFAAIVNLAEGEKDAEDTAKRFNTILSYFLNKEAAFLGFIPSSEQIRTAIKNQVPLSRSENSGKVMNEFQFIAQNIIGLAARQPKQLPISSTAY
jgi:flagellar biosynthesis protein FlhG